MFRRVALSLCLFAATFCFNTYLPIQVSADAEVGANIATGVPRIYWRTEDGLEEVAYGEDDLAILRYDRVLISTDAELFDNLGLSVNYNTLSRECTVKQGVNTLSSYLQELDWYKNGIRIYICDVRSDVVFGRTCIPFRAVMESLGYTVYYDHNQGSPYVILEK